VTICGLTVLRCTGAARATKRWSWNSTLQEWRKISYQAGAWFTPREHRVSELAGLVDVLDQVRRDPCALIVRGALAPDAAAAVSADPATRIRRRKHAKGGIDPTLIETDRRWIMLDIDGWPLPAWGDLADDPDTVIDHAIHELLPPPFHDVTCWWQLSSSAGFAAGILKCHLFFWLSEPASNEHLKAILKQLAPGVDRAPFSAAQPHFIADPIIENGHDPIPRRTGWRHSLEAEVVLPALRVLATLGDGDGLEGFHAPLRAATLRYARQCTRTGHRDDDAVKDTLRAAIRNARRDPAKRSSVDGYLGDDYLGRLIDGAFALLSSEPDLRSMRPHHAAPHQTVQEARDAVGEHVGAFLDRVASWHRWETTKPPAEHSALVVGVGVGKSKAGREALAAFMTAARGSIPHRILWLVPTHKLGNEALTAMEMLGLSVAVMRGRGAKVPISGPPDPEDAPEPLPMCLNLPAVADALLIHADVEKDVCGTGRFGEPSCPFHHACECQRQKAAVARADIVIAAHQALFHRLPKAATEGVGLVVVDESWWQVGLLSGREVRLAGFSEEPLLHPVLDRDDFRGTSPSRSWGRREADEATNDLHVLSGKAQAAFEATPHGAMVGKEAVVAAGLTTHDCADAVKLEWRRKVDGAIVPGMTAEARKKAVEKAAGNTSIPRRVGVWKALARLIQRICPNDAKGA
jgi:hypothetical protein